MQPVRAFIAGFGHAVRGCALGARGRNFIVMVLVAVAVVVVGVGVGLEARDWVVVALCIGAVLALELVNTAIELLADQVEPETHPGIRNVKDVAAGAVLVLSLTVALVGVVVFWPYVF